jgi:hypothetical protein
LEISDPRGFLAASEEQTQRGPNSPPPCLSLRFVSLSFCSIHQPFKLDNTITSLFIKNVCCDKTLAYNT